jgi:hypothetical protein
MAFSVNPPASAVYVRIPAMQPETIVVESCTGGDYQLHIHPLPCCAYDLDDIEMDLCNEITGNPAWIDGIYAADNGCDDEWLPVCVTEYSATHGACG